MNLFKLFLEIFVVLKLVILMNENKIIFWLKVWWCKIEKKMIEWKKVFNILFIIKLIVFIYIEMVIDSGLIVKILMYIYISVLINWVLMIVYWDIYVLFCSFRY